MRSEIALLVTIALAVLVVAPAAAQENGSVPVEVDVESSGGNSTTPEPALEAIDNATALESAEFVDGKVRLVLISDRSYQRVVLTDAGAVLEGGEVPQRRVTLREGRNAVSMPVTEFDGRVVVTIATRDVLYAVPIETSPPVIGGPWDATDVRTAAAGGGVGVAMVATVLGFRRVHGAGSAPRRKL